MIVGPIRHSALLCAMRAAPLGLCATRSVPLARRLVSTAAETPAALAQRLGADREALDAFLDALPADERKRASLRYVTHELEDEFGRADINRDGTLSFTEFKQWAAELVSEGDSRDQMKAPPTRAQLGALFVQHMTPYVGFGLVDNALMVLSGEAIDNTLGLMLGMSCLGAAALGNAFSNALGMALHGTIEVCAVTRRVYPFAVPSRRL